MIRFATIGTNWITEKLIDAGKQLDSFTLMAVYSRTEERAKEFAQKYGASLTFTNLEEMAKSPDIDAVYIASPNSLHAEQAIIMMNHGKHVLCEKPMASNPKEVEEMIACAKRNNVLLMEAVKGLFMPNFIALKDYVAKIGKVRKVFFTNCQYSSRYDAFKNGTVLNAFDPAFSNGALMDIGIYCLFPLVYLFGEPNKVTGHGHLLHSGVDGHGTVLLDYPDFDAVVTYSKITNSYVPSEIQGEDGSLILHKISAPSKVEIRYKDGTVEDLSQPQVENTMYYELEEFIRLIQDGKTESDVNRLDVSLQTAKIMKQIRDQIGLIFPAD